MFGYVDLGRAMTKKPSRAGKRIGPKSIVGGSIEIRMIESLLDQLGGAQTTAIEAAQEIIYDAWEAADRRKRVALAKKALALSPLCADAYVLLAQETARDLDQEIDLYRQGVLAGEKALGKACFREEVGHFWGLLETRPYMRARQGLAQKLWDKGSRDEAVAHFKDMLRLNPNDNQGIRYLLIDCLLLLGRDEEAADLTTTYKEDGSAAWIWSRALLAFRSSGDQTEAREMLSWAHNENRHVAPLLLGDKKMPRQLPAYISCGSKDEAVAYVHGAAPAWSATPGAIAWLRVCQSKHYRTQARLQGRP